VVAEPDAEPLFYLMARGIPKAEAQAILLQSFVGQSLEAFEDNETLYEFLNDKILDSLHA
jgi:Fe-S cluster assembly protein SufD